MSLKNRILSGSLAAAMVLGLFTGCSTVKKSDLSKDYSEIVAATYGSEKIYLDEVNYNLRNRQLMYEYYGAMYGMDIWAGGDEMVEALRQETMQSILQTRVLCAHAADYNVELTEEEKKLAETTLDEILNTEDNAAFLEIAGSDQEMLSRILLDNALANKVYHTILEETEIQTDEEKVRRNAVSYVLFKEKPAEEESESASAEDETEEAETYYTESDANAALAEVQGGKELKAVAEALELTASTGNYGIHEEQKTELGKKAITMAEGDSAVVYEEGTGWYVVVCDSEKDEDATAQAYDNAVAEEKEAHFAEVYKDMSKESFKVNEDVIASLDVVNTPVFNIGGSEEETEAESGSETETTGETEAESPSETAAQ